MKTMLGADPEFFVKNLETGAFMPICGLLGGTKEEPMQIRGLPKGFMHQEDGAAAEFNIPPTSDPETFSHNIQTAITHLTALLKRKGLAPDNLNRVIELTKEQIAEHPKLATIGCDPDINAYGANNGKSPVGRQRQLDIVQIGGIRGVGGHVHIGYDKNICPPDVLVKLLDICLAGPFIGKDIQSKRRKWWGLPGLYRDKPYGVEYRTLSNFWIWNQSYIFTIGRICVNLIESIQNNMIGWQALYNDYMKYYPYLRDSLLDERMSVSGYHKEWIQNHKVYKDLMTTCEVDKYIK